MASENKVNITSTLGEKVVDSATGFLSSIVKPAAQELGLLLKDHVTLWRFNNQVRILNKAKAACEKNNISPKSISPKLLVPLLENASLEDNEILQDKWANLLANLVDSKQNIENHVFPYLLSQLSIQEFECLEEALIRESKALTKLNAKIEKIKSTMTPVELEKIDELMPHASNAIKVDQMLEGLMHLGVQFHNKWLSIDDTFLQIKYLKAQLSPEYIQDFELSNLVRLGLVEVEPQHKVLQNSHVWSGYEIVADDYGQVNLRLFKDGEIFNVSPLGRLFIKACTDQHELSTTA